VNAHFVKSDPSQRLLVQCKYCHKNFQSRTLSDKFAHLIGCTVEVLQDYDLSSDSSKAVFGSGAAQPTQQPVATDIAPAAPGSASTPTHS